MTLQLSGYSPSRKNNLLVYEGVCWYNGTGKDGCGWLKQHTPAETKWKQLVVAGVLDAFHFCVVYTMYTWIPYTQKDINLHKLDNRLIREG